MPTKTKRKSVSKPRKAKASLKPSAIPPVPQPSRVFFLRSQTGGVPVTPDTALTYSPFWACVLYISNMMSILPLVHRQKHETGGGSDELNKSDQTYVLNIESNEETGANNFIKTLTAHACTWGNGYAEIEKSMRGGIANLWQITPDRVKLDRTISGKLIYDVCNPREPNTVLLPSDMLHIRGLSFDGLIGYCITAYAAKSIGNAIAADTTAGTLFENDSTPGGLLKHPRRLSENARKDLLESWQKRHGGAANKRVVALLEEGLEWVQTSMPPEAAQLVEHREFGPTDICRWFLVPPHKIGILDRATFSNIESQQIQAVMDCLMPWIDEWETETRRKLIGRNLRFMQQFKFNLNGLLRADSQVRAQLYQLLLDRGVLDINTVLELEDMNPIGSDGEKRFVQRNMITLDQAGMPETQTSLPSAGSPASPPSNNGDTKEPMSALEAEQDRIGAERIKLELEKTLREADYAAERERLDWERRELDAEKQKAEQFFLIRKVQSIEKTLNGLKPLLLEIVKRTLTREANVLMKKPHTSRFLNEFQIKQHQYLGKSLIPFIDSLTKLFQSNDKKMLDAATKAFLLEYQRDIIPRWNNGGQQTIIDVILLADKYADRFIQLAIPGLDA